MITARIVGFTLALTVCIAATAAPTGAISGVVADADGAPVENACVVVCAPNGVPIDAATREHFSPARAGDDEALFASTDASGRFHVDGLPAGRYRLVAQSWDERDSVDGVLELNGRVVRLHGIADDVVVDDAKVATVEIAPLGDARLDVHVDSGNNDTLLVISSGALNGDAILGFAGWGGEFMPNAFGVNRMPLGETTFLGMPAGEVHVGLFANDNNPGWGGGSLELDPGASMRIEIPFVASWSDGVHAPPPALVPLVERVRAAGLTDWRAMMAHFHEHDVAVELSVEGGPLAAMFAISSKVDQMVPLGDDEVRLGDLLASLGYIGMRGSIEAQGRTPNPYVAPVVTPIDEVLSDGSGRPRRDR